MSFFIVFISSFVVLSSFVPLESKARSSSTIPETFSQLDQPEYSIWKIQDPNERNGTGFFIEKKYFTTTFHVISTMLDDKNTLDSIALSQEGNPSIIQIQQVLALSAIHDLAILETKEETTNYLNINLKESSQRESFFVSAYPNGIFNKIKQTGNVFYENEQMYTFPVDNSYLYGASGSPVLIEQRQVVGIMFSSTNNILRAIKTHHLQNLARGNTGLNCYEFTSAKRCIKQEVENLKELAEQGDEQAQNMLAQMYYEGKGVQKSFEGAFYWFEKAAQQNHLPSVYMMAYMYYKGRGVQQDFQVSF